MPEPSVLTRSTDGTPEEVRKMHRRQAGRLLRLLDEHEDKINEQGRALFRRCAFVLWLDGRDG